MEMEKVELSGSLEESRVPDLIFSISQSKSTGLLYLTRGDVQKALYFQKGRLVFAKSNSIDDRLGEQLLKQKKITYAQLIEAGKLITPTKRLGTILVEKALITADELVEAIINQIKEIIFSVFPWNEGDYLFEGGSLPSKEIIILNIPTEEIIIQGINKIDSWSWIRQAVGELDTCYKISDRFEHFEGLANLPSQFLKLIEFFATEHTVQQACEFSSLGDFETYKALWALSVLGIIEKKAEPLPVIEEKELIEGEVKEELAIDNNEVKAVEDNSVFDSEFLKEQKREEVKLPEQSENETDESLGEVGKPEIVMQQSEPGIVKEDKSFQIIEPVSKEIEEPAPHVYLEQAMVELSFSDLSELTDSADSEESKDEDAKEEIKREVDAELNEDEIIANIAIYNSKFKYIFEIVRIELGGLANDFLFTSLNKAKISYPLLFDNVRANEFGALDENALKNNILGNLIYDYREGLEALVNIQLNIIEKFLETTRAQEIRSIIEEI